MSVDAPPSLPYPGRTAPTDETRDLAVGDLLVGLYIDGDERYYQVFKVTPRQVKMRALPPENHAALPVHGCFHPHLYTARRFGRCFAYNGKLTGPLWRVEWPTDDDRARSTAGRARDAPYELYQRGAHNTLRQNHLRVLAIRAAELAERRREQEDRLSLSADSQFGVQFLGVQEEEEEAEEEEKEDVVEEDEQGGWQ